MFGVKMLDVIGWTGVVGAIVLFLAGLWALVDSWRSKAKVRTAADKAAKLGEEVNADAGTLEKHAGIDFKGQWEALAALATALKDLDQSSRLFFLSLAFLAVAGATIGLVSIGDGVGAIGNGLSAH